MTQTNQINIFVDWGMTKPHVALIEEKSVPCIKSESTFNFTSIQELLESIKTSAGGVKSVKVFNVFIESGAPHKLLYQFIREGMNVNICQGQLVKQLRGENPKTDENDVAFIKQLYEINLSAFKPLSMPEVEDIKLKYYMSQYLCFMRDCARFKNKQKAFEREFGERDKYKDVIKDLEKKKVETLKLIQPLIQKDYEKVKTKGLGIRLVAGLLASAHPKNFPTLSRYHSYCGYTASANKTHKFNREAKTTAYQCIEQFIKFKHDTYYPLYIKIKEDMKKRFPEDSKGKIHGRAMVRTATIFLTGVYKTLHQEPTSGIFIKSNLRVNVDS